MKKWKILIPSLIATASMPLIGLVGCNMNENDDTIYLDQVLRSGTEIIALTSNKLSMPKDTIFNFSINMGQWDTLDYAPPFIDFITHNLDTEQALYTIISFNVNGDPIQPGEETWKRFTPRLFTLYDDFSKQLVENKATVTGQIKVDQDINDLYLAFEMIY